jgi:hypothetical protein
MLLLLAQHHNFYFRANISSRVWALACATAFAAFAHPSHARALSVHARRRSRDTRG